MADPVMSNLPLRKVLECSSDSYMTVEQISKRHNEKYPPSLNMESIARFSDSLRGRLFKEKLKQRKVHLLVSEIEELYTNGYLEMQLSNFDISYSDMGELEKETKFYRWSKLGRSAIFSVTRKKS